MDLSLLGWSNRFAQTLPDTQAAARVASENRGVYELWTAGGVVTAQMAGDLKDARPVTGDWVGLEVDTGRIRALLPRKSKVSRKKAGRAYEEQVLAANVDVLFLVTGLDGDFNPRRLERYLIVANESGAEAVVVLNKSDLCDDVMERMKEVDRVAPDVPVALLSALSDASVLHRYVESGQTAALLGSSGVGKSTIVNRLLGVETQATRAVREDDSRGRHTTSGRQLFLLPQGWVLMDTPGLRELEPWANADAASAVFTDIEQASAGCRFRDCRHETEPGCAVLAAVSAGLMDGARLESFRKLRGELARLERMQDIHAAQEQKRKWKVIHKAMRNYQKY